MALVLITVFGVCFCVSARQFFVFYDSGWTQGNLWLLFGGAGIGFISLLAFVIGGLYFANVPEPRANSNMMCGHMTSM
ncbi:MAG: hypothetical protein WDN67_04385 [Candidatus Moraniibacteriota bacterium]